MPLPESFLKSIVKSGSFHVFDHPFLSLDPVHESVGNYCSGHFFPQEKYTAVLTEILRTWRIFLHRCSLRISHSWGLVLQMSPSHCGIFIANIIFKPSLILFFGQTLETRTHGVVITGWIKKTVWQEWTPWLFGLLCVIDILPVTGNAQYFIFNFYLTADYCWAT